MRTCSAILTVTQGRGGTKQYPVKRVETYTTEQSIDNDVDSFSLDLGDSLGQLSPCLERDNEVRVNLFLSDLKGRMHPIFTGIADTVQKTQDMVLSMHGRDTPSVLAVESDAMPGKFIKIAPKKFIEKRAASLGITNVAIAPMSSIQTVFTDGSEKEWQLWYRIARMKGMYMWSDETGKLIIDKLGYSLAPTYKIGVGPGPDWLQYEDITYVSSKTRQRRVLMYGEDAKKGRALVAQGVDVTIRNWKRKPLSIATSTVSKTMKDLKKEADDTVFESIVGAQEIELTIRDTGTLVQQNKMCQVNIPAENLRGIYFIVGVTRQGGPDGLRQIVRLREKGFALSKRIPTAPTLIKGTTRINLPTGSIGAAIATLGGIRWPDAFVRATQEFGVPAGWDFAVFLTALLAICQQESGFTNERQNHSGAINHVEWLPFDQWLQSPSIIGKQESEANLENLYRQTFANAKNNMFNPFYPSGEAGVGPMQLTTASYKSDADQFGWARKPKIGEYDGGRWNPESNIRAAAKAFVGKLQQQPAADPSNANSIQIGFERYNGSGASAKAYGKKVKTIFDSMLKQVQAQLATIEPVPANTADRTMTLPGPNGNNHDIILPANTPVQVRKAINFCRAQLGQPYQYGGWGPLYDCASLVTASYAGSPDTAATLDTPRTGHHGDTTYTLFTPGRFESVAKDSLQPGDFVFFIAKVPNKPEHMGIYVEDGLFIHDPHSGDFVKVGSLGDAYYRDNYAGARRVVVWTAANR